MRTLVAVVAVLALSGCDQLDPMMRQREVKVKPYQVSRFDEDGIAMRAPPPHAVPAGGALGVAVASGTATDGKAIPRIPVPVTPELVAVGRKKFEVNCAVCHGLLGDGDSLVAKNMSQRPPPSLHQRVWAEDGRYYQVVTHGFGVMPSYASALTVEERWAVVAYVRALQLSQRARVDQLSAEDRARLEREATEVPR